MRLAPHSEDRRPAADTEQPRPTAVDAPFNEWTGTPPPVAAQCNRQPAAKSGREPMPSVDKSPSVDNPVTDRRHSNLAARPISAGPSCRTLGLSVTRRRTNVLNPCPWFDFDF